MYDILLVSVPLRGKTKEENFGYLPAPYYLKGFLNKYDIKTKIIDGHSYIEKTEDLIKEIKKYEFRWLGLSLLSSLEIDLALNIGQHFKNVVYGGNGARDIQNQNVIIGDGYNTLLNLLKTDKLKDCPPLQLEDRPIPDYSDLKYSEDNINMLKLTGSEGCINNCSFCNVRDIWKHYRQLPGKTLANQSIEIIKRNTEFNFIYYTDALFNGSNKELKSFCEHLIDNNTTFLWKCRFCIKKDFDPEMFDLLEQSNCYEVSLGIESGSEKVRNSMNKSMKDISIYTHIFSLIVRNIRINMLLIVGYLTEDTDEFDKTLEMIRFIAENLSPEQLKMIRIYAQPYYLDDSTRKRVLKNNEYINLNNGPHFWSNENSDFTERFRRINQLYNTANRLGFECDTLKPKVRRGYYEKFQLYS
jgi:radical SAM superfamily enzyme YgiQ (UPF0313 family)